MSDFHEIPLFPLRIVLFPGGRLDLQIFEQRYIDLVSHCLRSDTGFGICMLKSGDEVVREASRQTIHRVGTYCRIVDWDQLDNGLLGITVAGLTKFRVEDCWQGDDAVLRANVLYSLDDRTDSTPLAVGEAHEGLVDLLQSLESHPMVAGKNLQTDYANLREVGWRLSELIPVDAGQKQKLLELDDPAQRIEQLETLVADLANNG